MPFFPGQQGAPTGLTDAQLVACDAFLTWLGSRQDGLPFVLRGYAGTGKTFLSMRLLGMVEERGLCWTTCAPTHKAVEVLRDYLRREGLRASWYPATIHRLLRLKLRRIDGVEVCEETDQTAMALQNLDLVLVDEASMVDSKLLQVALQCAHPFGTRLVFVGDPAQLSPVGEASSPVFSLGRAVGASLTQVVRHGGPVLRLATGLRQKTLPSSQPPQLDAIRQAEGSVAALDRTAWLAQAQQALRRAVELDHPDHARILCYTNRALDRLVPFARRAIHGELADQLPVLPGEVLITRSGVMAAACSEGALKGENPDLVMGSNRELVVRDVAVEHCDLADVGLPDAPLIETYTVDVEADELQLKLRLLPPPGSAPRHQLNEVLQQLKLQARKAGGASQKALWRRFYQVRDAFASVGPAAVLTVHRSQGSTFGQVFIEQDVFWPEDEAVRRQLLYVAVSRASEAVVLVGARATDRSHRDALASALRCPVS